MQVQYNARLIFMLLGLRGGIECQLQSDLASYDNNKEHRPHKTKVALLLILTAVGK